MIVCENLAVGYGREVVLRGVDLRIAPGTLLPFVGHNGAGKTTLLRTLLGLLPPLAGRLATPFHRNAPGYVAQARSIDPLYPVTVAQVVAMGLAPALGWWRRPSRAQRATLTALLERFDLRAQQHRPFRELSGGMRQKALLARALVAGADVLVMDEPVSELDERAEADLLTHLATLCRTHGKTVLLAHHGLARIEGLAREVVLVDRGAARRTDSATARDALLGGVRRWTVGTGGAHGA